MSVTAAPVLAIEDLYVRFATPDGVVTAVDGISLTVGRGECVGVVGESGSGKSQTFMTVMGLLPSNASVDGAIRFQGESLLDASPKRRNDLRGAKITMIFQDPLTSLTPHMRIGDQIGEVLRVHSSVRGEAAAKIAVDWLQRVRIPEAKRRLRQYPHELSGGMRQRVMIAMSMVCGPDLLIADEPTTALDVTVQAEVLDIMDELKRETGMGLVLITHDMGVIARMADRVQVMKSGRYVESGDVDQVFGAPRTDYARGLIAAMPRLDRPDGRQGAKLGPPPAETTPPVIDVRDIAVHFPVVVERGLIPKRAPLRAVDGVSFALRPGETLGLVGESGCGKSTLARAALKLVPATAGAVSWIGRDASGLNAAELRRARKDLQIVFQDPLAALDPRMTVGASIAEPFLIHRPSADSAERDAAVRRAMERVGLDTRMINRYPHELSGGQNQRVGIARATILEPKVIVCDEAVSALDVTIQAQILDLLIDLQNAFGSAMLFISHDLAVVREVSHRVMVLYLGRVVELADRDAIYADARHPYTRALIAAAPIPDPTVERARLRVKLDGEPPSPLDPRAGLRFLPSKLAAGEIEYRPRLNAVAPGHWVAEHDADDGLRG